MYAHIHTYIYIYRDRYTYTETDRRTDGQKDLVFAMFDLYMCICAVGANARIHTYTCTEREIDRQTDRQMDIQTDAQTDGQTYSQRLAVINSHLPLVSINTI